jgi:hypothetical protein
MTDINLKPFIDAVEFVKAHPAYHNQFSAAAGGPRCIVSYACTNANLAAYDYEELAKVTGISVNELRDLYITNSNEIAIEVAESLISKYSPAPVTQSNNSGEYYVKVAGASRYKTDNLEFAHGVSDYFRGITPGATVNIIRVVITTTEEIIA